MIQKTVVMRSGFGSFSSVPYEILLADFDEKLGREDIFKPTNGNESLHQDNNDNGFRIVNFATSKS